MNRSDISEIKKTYKPDRTSMVRVAGCYVNGDKDKVCTFVSRFSTLDENEQFKYLDILSKTLSGKLKDQLQELLFSYEEELEGEKYRSLNLLRNTELENEAALNAYYDAVIDAYEEPGNFLILLFYDVLDIMQKTSDGFRTGESTESFRYIVSSICPVELADPGLSYHADENTIGLRSRDWVVGKPETGFLFPVLTDRSQDIHSVLFYSKNPKAPHREIPEKVLGLNETATISEQKGMIKEIVTRELGYDQKELIDEVLSDFHYSLTEQDEENVEKYGEDAKLELSREVIDTAMKQTELSAVKSAAIAAKIENGLTGSELYADTLADSSLVKKGSVRAEKKELIEKIDFLEAISSENADFQLVKVSKDFSLKIQEIDGVRCYVIPEDEVEL